MPSDGERGALQVPSFDEKKVKVVSGRGQKAAPEKGLIISSLPSRDRSPHERRLSLGTGMQMDTRTTKTNAILLVTCNLATDFT